MTVIFWLILSGMFFAGGEFLSKSYVLQPSWSVLGALIVLYAAGALFWIPALKAQPELAVTGTLWSVITMMVTVLLGVVVFNEALSVSRIVGIGFALLAVVFLSR